MKMNKKGFTLVELLAIIVILAIIAVITVPIVLNVIENSRKGAARSSALGYVDAIKLAYMERYAGINEEGTNVDFQISGVTQTTPLKVNKEGAGVVCSGVNFTATGTLEIASCTATVNGKDYVFHTYTNGSFAD